MAGAGVDREIVRETDHSSITLSVVNGMSIPTTSYQRPPLQTVLAMSKGGGVESYSENSQIQYSIRSRTAQYLIAALQRVKLPCDGQPVAVADLGCSSGPNSIANVAQIVDQLRPRLTNDVEFQAYFNDLPSNDFNNLFQLLTRGDNSNDFFAAAVPGTFYGRLFPRSSVHVFHSTLCLHWLSKVPDVVCDKNSPAYNRGNPWIAHGRSAVATAYKEQAASDLENFLLAREVELVEGGLLYLFFLGRLASEPDDSKEFKGRGLFLAEILPEILSDLVAEGVVAEEHLDALNIPIYFRSLDEIRTAVESCSSAFELLTMKVETWETKSAKVFGTTTYHEQASKITRAWKAVFNGLLEAHLPQHACHVFWQRCDKVMEANISEGRIDTSDRLCVVCLIRK